MFGNFSSGLKLTDLDDFITPSQECIKPVQPQVSERLKSKKGVITVESEATISSQKYEKAKITLNDCLACSGCITSAEVVLVNEQSLDTLLSILRKNNELDVDDKLVVVLSLSVQSVLSVALRFNLDAQIALKKIIGYFKNLGVHYVFDLNLARCLSIIEAQKEFVEKYKSFNQEKFPIFASACPGWVCYAEKTHGFILPNISTVRSPQQIMGVLVKRYWANSKGLPPNKVFHAALMPCFDKKLEASRSQFFIDEFSSREVDCVITSIELEQLLEKESVDLSTINGSNFDKELSSNPNLSTHAGSGSGGFAHHVFCYASKYLFGVEEHEMEWKTLRNKDMQEINLTINGETVLRFAIANGFRNIQNFVQKMKRKKCQYDYIEIMACPSGCLNGGAQIRAQEGQSVNELISHLEEIYGRLPKFSESDEKSTLQLYEEAFGSNYSILKTSYKEIEKNINPLGIKW